MTSGSPPQIAKEYPRTDEEQRTWGGGVTEDRIRLRGFLEPTRVSRISWRLSTRARSYQLLEGMAVLENRNKNNMIVIINTAAINKRPFSKTRSSLLT